MSEKIDPSVTARIEGNEPRCSNAGCCPPKTPITRVAPKVGRNDPCICGNGRKFKKCCGRNL
ncbi:MAG: zinc chelation protein SecC [Deltaproteobacteria bacterium]|nr:zinc chelation protein SecC [Gammaproteobacteria bacterium]MBP79215.1 zinc chelation protein SecC [Deltaproteobacteria bacterium]MDC3339940.1 SEC-C metal-binding domain-containing protein [bacterium]